MRKRRSGKASGLFMIAMLVIMAGFVYFARKNMHFDPQSILKNSILKEKTFETNVVEITSPKNGIKAYWFFDDTNPIISVSFLFKKSGFAYDFKQKNGVSNLLASMLDEGAGVYSSQAFKGAMEDYAIDISFGSDADDISGSMQTLKQNQAKAEELLKLALTKPKFELKDLNRVKEQILHILKQQQEKPASIAALEFNKLVYGEHPYSRNALGNEKVVKALNDKDLREFAKSHLTQDNLVVGIAGDITQEEAKRLLDDVFGDLPKSGIGEDISMANISFNGQLFEIKKQFPQSFLIFAGPSVARLDDDFYPLYVANHIFGGSGLTSRLSIAAREEEGLTYGIGTYLSLSDKANLLKGNVSAEPSNMPRVLEIIKAETLKMGEKGVSLKEFEEAKNYLISSYNLRFAAISDIALMLTMMQRDSLGIDFLQKRNSYVQNVKLEDVNRVAKEYFKGNAIFVNVGE